MRVRRAALVAGLLGFSIVATRRVGASAGPWEVEGGAYGGSAPGHIACGPSVRVAYGGVGGELRYTEALEKSSGGAFDVGALLEQRRQRPIDCNATTCPHGPGEYDVSGLVPGGRVRLGGDWRYFGFRLGVILLAGPGDTGGHWAAPFPDVALRIGGFEGVRWVLGLGAYDLATYPRPGLYTGLLYSGGGWQMGFHAGLHYTVDVVVPRESIGLQAPLSKHLRLRGDLGLMQGVAADDRAGADFLFGIGADL